MTTLKDMAEAYARMADDTLEAETRRHAFLAGAWAAADLAAKLAYFGVETSAGHSHSSRAIASAIRNLIPDT